MRELEILMESQVRMRVADKLMMIQWSARRRLRVSIPRKVRTRVDAAGDFLLQFLVALFLHGCNVLGELGEIEGEFELGLGGHGCE